MFPGILHFTNKNFPDSFTWGDSIGKLRALLARILSFNFKILYLTKIMIIRNKEEGVKKGNTPMECDLKGLERSQLRKRS